MIALIDIETVYEWREEVEAATSSYCAECDYVWLISNVQSLEKPFNGNGKAENL